MGANILIAAYKKFGIGTGAKYDVTSDIPNTDAKYEYGPNKKGYARDGRDLDGDGYGEIDCSALVSSAVKDAGYNIKAFVTNDIFTKKENGCFTTFAKNNFDINVNGQSGFDDEEDLIPGDILLYRNNEADRDGSYNQHIVIFFGYDDKGQKIFYGSQTTTGPGFVVVKNDSYYGGQTATLVAALRPKDSLYNPDNDTVSNTTLTDAEINGYRQQMTGDFAQSNFKNSAWAKNMRSSINGPISKPPVNPQSDPSCCCHNTPLPPETLAAIAAGLAAAKAFQYPRDPFVLDLDDDGVETVNINSGVFFDNNADNIKTLTGWIKPDDGLLVRDLNNNGAIDTGRELFGDQTMLKNGQLATNGYAALADLDTNQDGKIDASDAAFGELKIWRDINQDGISQASELQALGQAGINSIGLSSTYRIQWQNGNTLGSSGTYTRADGTTAQTSEVNLATNAILTEFSDSVEIPETLLDLPYIGGMGKMRDLQQAAVLSPELAEIIRQYASAPTREAQLSLLDQLLASWADTSGMAKSLDDRRPERFKVEYLNFGSISRSSHLQQNTSTNIVTNNLCNADNPLIDDAYRNLITTWNNKIHVLEAVNGSYFFQLPDQPQEGGGATTGIWSTTSNQNSLTPNPDNRQTLVVSYSQQQLNLLDTAYNTLRQAIYEKLILQTRLASYLEYLDFSINDPESMLDFTTLTQTFQDKIAADPQNGITDLIEFNRYTRDMLSGTQWDGVAMMEDAIRTTALTPEMEQLYLDLGVSTNLAVATNDTEKIILGDLQDRWISGGNGNDILLGGAGNETLFGNNGNDIISGGAGNDQLNGGYGDDTYIFRKGNGNDTIGDGHGNDTVFFSGLNSEDISVTRGNFETMDELTFTVKETGETLRISGDWNWNGTGYNYNIANSFIFADGTTWDREEALRQSVTKPTEGNDIIVGSRVDDTITGLGGNDTIIGNRGDDIIDGGAGNDILMGSAYIYTPWNGPQIIQDVVEANGNDTYLFGRGDGHDTIIDGDDTVNTDTLRFKEGVASTDVSFARTNNDLILTITDTGDSVTIRNYFQEEGYWAPEQRTNEIERIEFSDGTLWTAASIGAVLLTGSDNDDTIIGYRGDDTITGGAGNDTIDARTGNDTIYGGDGNDSIHAGLGNDIIDGGKGDDIIYGSDSRTTWRDTDYSSQLTDNDTYLFGYGDGHDTIVDATWRGGNSDTIRFREGVVPSDVIFQAIGRYNYDLKIILGDGSDTITVSNWFWGGQYQIERFEFSDGTVLDNAWVNANLTIPGTAADDILTGTSQSEILKGLAGDDTLYGLDGNDILDGGTGSDMMVGGFGDDVYRFGRGDGHDTAYEGFGDGYFWVNSTNDAVEFKTDVTPDDVIVRRVGNDMVLSIKGTDDRLTVKDTFNPDRQPNQVEFVRFADGTSWDMTTMLARTLLASEGDDILTGTSGNDVMDGKGGNDILKGGPGNDTYIFGRGSGNDAITEEWDWDSSNTIQFTDGITVSDLGYTYDGYDLVITIKDTGETLRIVNCEIDNFNFADGTILTWDDIDLLAEVTPDSESLIGAPGDDVLIGTDLDSTILGLDGNDTLSGTGGRDNLLGGAGNDVITGGTGDDYLYGEAGDDLLIGESGRDYLEGGTGANTYRFEQGTGQDYVRVRLADGQDDIIEFGEGITAADLQVQLGNQSNSYGGSLPGDCGYATLVVGTGDDSFSIVIGNTDIARSSAKRFVFKDGTELTLEQVIALNDGGIAGGQYGDSNGNSLTGSNADDYLYGYDGNDTIHARAGYDYVDGGNGDDLIDGGGGDDGINGGNGNDLIAGGTGDDDSDGGKGDDLYLFNRGDGNDTITQPWNPEGIKTLSFGADITQNDITAFVNADGEFVLLVDNGAGGSIRLLPYDGEGIERITGVEGLPLQRVQFVDDGGNVRMFDFMELVRAKLPSLMASSAAAPVALFDNADAFDITFTTMPAGGDAAVAYAQSSDLFGTATYTASPVPTDGDDRIVGTEWADTLNGGNGNNLLYGMGGDDYLQGGTGRDRIDAGDGNDVVFGGSGNDLIYGSGGDDSIFAGPGNDIAYGGLGSDTYAFNAGDGRLTIEDDYEESSGGGYGGDYGGGYGGSYGGTTNVANVLQFGAGITIDDLKFSSKDGYLVIDIPTTGDQVRLAGYDPNRPTLTRAVDFFRFADGTETSRQDILDQGVTITVTEDENSLTIGTGGNGVTLTGTDGNDNIIGGGGTTISTPAGEMTV